MKKLAISFEREGKRDRKRERKDAPPQAQREGVGRARPRRIGWEGEANHVGLREISI
jgi:hypothetical protein